MSFSETIFLFVLALVVFGPKKLPEIARQAGKLLAELRRASNEFKSQIQTEIDQAEVQKRKAAAAPVSAPPPGAVATMSLNPAAVEASAHPPAAAEATQAGPDAQAAPAAMAENKTDPDYQAPAHTFARSSGTEPMEPIPGTPQDSHA